MNIFNYFLNRLYWLDMEKDLSNLIFCYLLQITIFLSITALLIMLFKLIFKNKVSAKCHLLIWVILLIRVVVPFLPQSNISVFNSFKIDEQAVKQSIRYTVKVNQNEIEENENESITQSPPQSQTITDSYNEYQSTENYTIRFDIIAIALWISGTVFLLGYFVVILKVFKHKLKKSRKECDEDTQNLLYDLRVKMGIPRKVRVYFADTTPLLAGVFKPVIYLPHQYKNDEIKESLIHELCHLKNYDILWSMIATLILCFNWYNPIIWVAFFMFKRDIEVFCDERTLRYLDNKQEYAMLLLKTATGRKGNFVLGTTSLQSGKADVKRRITYMAKFKKPTIKTAVVAMVIVFAISLSCLTNALIKVENQEEYYIEYMNSKKVKIVPEYNNEDKIVCNKELPHYDFLDGLSYVREYSAVSLGDTFEEAVDNKMISVDKEYIIFDCYGSEAGYSGIPGHYIDYYTFSDDYFKNYEKTVRRVGDWMITDIEDGVCINQYIFDESRFGDDKSITIEIPEIIEGKKVIKLGSCIKKVCLEGEPLVGTGDVDYETFYYDTKQMGIFCDIPNYYNVTVKIPKTVRDISRDAFSYADYLLDENIEHIFACVYEFNYQVDEDNPYYSSENGSLYNKDKTWLLDIYPIEKGEFVVPETVECIYDYIAPYWDMTIYIGDNVSRIMGYYYIYEEDPIRIKVNKYSYAAMFFLSQENISKENLIFV